MIPPRPEHPTQDELRQSWAKTASLLEEAKRQLPQSGFEDFEEYILQNELELALDELERVGEEGSPLADFWQTLAAAADNMKLLDRATKLRARGNASWRKEKL